MRIGTLILLRLAILRVACRVTDALRRLRRVPAAFDDLDHALTNINRVGAARGGHRGGCATSTAMRPAAALPIIPHFIAGAFIPLPAAGRYLGRAVLTRYCWENAACSRSSRSSRRSKVRSRSVSFICLRTLAAAARNAIPHHAGRPAGPEAGVGRQPGERRWCVLVRRGHALSRDWYSHAGDAKRVQPPASMAVPAPHGPAPALSTLSGRGWPAAPGGGSALPLRAAARGGDETRPR